MRDNNSSCINVENYIRSILRNYMKYFGRDAVLNSDGRKFLNDLAREAMKCSKDFKNLLRKVRKDPTLENFMKLAEAVLGAEEARYLLTNSLYVLEGRREFTNNTQ